MINNIYIKKKILYTHVYMFIITIKKDKLINHIDIISKYNNRYIYIYIQHGGHSLWSHLYDDRQITKLIILIGQF